VARGFFYAERDYQFADGKTRSTLPTERGEQTTALPDIALPSGLTLRR
jgi:hypothetical protein